jgi:cytochrome P450
MPTRYEDLFEIARDVTRFSSRDVGVAPRPADAAQAQLDYLGVRLAPIASDPPEHTWTRKLLLPFFSVTAIARYEPETRDLCRSLIDGFIANGRVDAAEGYAQQIPPRIIASMLGIPKEMSDTFVGWVRGILELAVKDPELRVQSRAAIFGYFRECIDARRDNPGEDLISYLLHVDVDGQPVPEPLVLGMCVLLLIAGIDTTWSSIGSALWHLAQHPDDRRRLVAEPDLMPNAVEELLRAYSPVTMARIVAEDCEYAGRALKAGDRVLMSFPAANRDPERFDRPDEVLLDREKNPHIAFGVGIHRCVGSNLARMEMRVALEEWLARIPEFRLEDAHAVTWAGGQVRGPRALPVVFG